MITRSGYFQQMVDSQQETSYFKQMKSYLIATHSNQMPHSQHLSWAWDLQRQDGKKLTDFTGQLENTLRVATIHVKIEFKKDDTKELTVDTAISLVSAMLMSEKIKTWTPNIYPHLMKMMANHYTAGSIASEAQWYLDRSVKTDNTTSSRITTSHNNPKCPRIHQGNIIVNKQLAQKKTHKK